LVTWVNEEGGSALDGLVHHAARVDHEAHLLAADVSDRASLHHVRNVIAVLVNKIIRVWYKKTFF
jgi:hypothetical protein